MKVTGKITKVLDTQKGTSAAGKDWQKLSFILETTEDYNNLYCFEFIRRRESRAVFKIQ